MSLGNRTRPVRLHRGEAFWASASEMKAIVLCGGLGTRLGSLTVDTPKPLIDVAGKPFLSHVLERLQVSGVSDVCLAVGFQWQKLETAFGQSFNGQSLSYSIEDQPLGTGGAVRQALIKMGWSEAFVVNGDTLVDVDLRSLQTLAENKFTDLVITLKHINEAGRFGKVTLQPDGRVASFEEKGQSGAGLINAGLYFVRAGALRFTLKDSFSLEQDVMVAHVSDLAIYGHITQGYFIDMGVPEDLARARAELVGGFR
jgi:D-glycero-alpha-D-manno-heptose 1-phosphate guanylyltransferase